MVEGLIVWTFGDSVPGRNCLEDTTGLSYTGNHAISESGRACRAWWGWWTWVAPEGQERPNATVVNAQNFCRNVVIFGTSSTMTQRHSCFTYHDGQQDLTEYCDIPECHDVMTTQTPSTTTTIRTTCKLLDIKHTGKKELKVEDLMKKIFAIPICGHCAITSNTIFCRHNIITGSHVYYKHQATLSRWLRVSLNVCYMCTPMINQLDSA